MVCVWPLFKPDFCICIQVVMTLIVHLLKKTNSVSAEQHFISELCIIVAKTQTSVVGSKAHLKDLPFLSASSVKKALWPWQWSYLAVSFVLVWKNKKGLIVFKHAWVTSCMQHFFFSFSFWGGGIMKQNQKPCVTFVDLCADVSRIWGALKGPGKPKRRGSE